MTHIASREEEYAAFVVMFYRLHPQIVEDTYWMLYQDSHTWELPPQEAIAALAEQDAMDGEESWAFREEFDHGLP